MEYLLIIIALAGIVYGADRLVSGSVSIARKYHVSDFVIGAAIVGIGTSMPELTVSFLGAWEGNSDVAIGNIVGSNIFNILGIIGVTALFFPIKVSKENMRFEIPLCLGVSILLMLLIFNFFNGSPQALGSIDGLILLALFAIFMWYSFHRDRKHGYHASEEHDQDPTSPLWLAMVRVLIGLAILILSCDIFVDNAIVIARKWGLSEAVISITLIACGTSLPELAASIAAAFKKNTQLALGNIIGSNIFNITLILGLSSQVCTLSAPEIGIADYLVMIAAVIMIMLFGISGHIGRTAGAIMLTSFVAYCVYVVL